MSGADLVLHQSDAAAALDAIADPVVRRLVQQVIGTIIVDLVDADSIHRPGGPIDLLFLVRALARALGDPSLIAAIAGGDISAGMPWPE